jgi:hypothetical protein
MLMKGGVLSDTALFFLDGCVARKGIGKFVREDPYAA